MAGDLHGMQKVSGSTLGISGYKYQVAVDVQHLYQKFWRAAGSLGSRATIPPPGAGGPLILGLYSPSIRGNMPPNRTLHATSPMR